MRWFALLLLVPFVSGLVVESTGNPGNRVAVYGSLIVYESGGEIHVYDVDLKSDEVIAKGSNPSIFGYIVVFEAEETDDFEGDGDFSGTVIQYVDLKDKAIVN